MVSRLPLVLAMVLAACGAAHPDDGSRSPTPLADYLIQNVCLDEAGAMTSGDPAVCDTSRDLRPGESAPYRLTDLDRESAGRRYQSVSSVPMRGGTVRIGKQMGEGIAASFDPDRDGYDLVEQHGTYVSFIATHDPQCGEQRFSGVGENDGWLLFPNRMPLRAGLRRHDMVLARRDALPGCPAKKRISRVKDKQIAASWTAPHSVMFESGKVLQTIVSEHRAHYDLSRRNNAIERFYFTREYGLSRWEAWIPERRCRAERPSADPLRMCDPAAPTNFLRGRCAAESATATWGGQRWVRIDCRDTTFHTVRP